MVRSRRAENRIRQDDGALEAIRGLGGGLRKSLCLEWSWRWLKVWAEGFRWRLIPPCSLYASLITAEGG